MYPVFFFYARNMGEFSIGNLGSSVLVVAGASVALWLVLRVVLHDGMRAGLVCSLFWVWFFSFGRLHSLVGSTPAEGFAIPTQTVFVIVYSFILIVAAVLLVELRRGVGTLSAALNVMAVALVGWQVVQITSWEVTRVRTSLRLHESAPVPTATGGARPTVRPSIFWIILDGYGRSDTLRRVYHLDTSGFVRHLESKGFQVVRDARANYDSTLLSLACTANMEYLDGLAARVGVKSRDFQPLEKMLANSRVMAFLRQHGYRIAAFSSGFDGTQLRNADRYIEGGMGPSEFTAGLLETTPIPLLLSVGRPGYLTQKQTDAQRTLYTLDHLPDVVAFKPPVFVFAHVLCPHSAYVMTRYGPQPPTTSSPAHPAAAQTYEQRVLFVNRKVENAVDQILARSKWPTVIIVQGDHGPLTRPIQDYALKQYCKERLGILLAIHLPEGSGMKIPQSLSAVNVFRIVLTRYLGANLRPLPDESYQSSYYEPYLFTRVTDFMNAPSPSQTPPRSARVAD